MRGRAHRNVVLEPQGALRRRWESVSSSSLNTTLRARRRRGSAIPRLSNPEGSASWADVRDRPTADGGAVSKVQVGFGSVADFPLNP